MRHHYGRQDIANGESFAKLKKKHRKSNKIFQKLEALHQKEYRHKLLGNAYQRLVLKMPSELLYEILELNNRNFTEAKVRDLLVIPFSAKRPK